MTSLRTAGAALSEPDVRQFAADWFAALDRHDDIGRLLPMLADDGLEMRFPEGTSYGHAGFRQWYDTVTRRFFDEVHTLTEVTPTGTDGAGTDVRVTVNWQARIWDPPAPRSTWIGFDARQSWRLEPGPGGRPRISLYVVDSLEPMPGSAAL
jgi:hypothetical protein